MAIYNIDYIDKNIISEEALRLNIYDARTDLLVYINESLSFLYYDNTHILSEGAIANKLKEIVNNIINKIREFFKKIKECLKRKYQNLNMNK